jgi:hypothetical protein
LRTLQPLKSSTQLPLTFDAPHLPEHAFMRAYRRLGLRRLALEFQVEYRAFTGLRSNICLQGNRVRVRISDVLQGAPALVLEALAEILLAQLFRRQASLEARECYLAYVCDPEVRRRANEIHRARGCVRLLPARGRHFDLEEVFASVNQRYFQGELAPCRIGWSARHSRSVLGRYDSVHETITINKSLDSASVPRQVVEYLVFHEMLHIRFPLERRGARRVIHSHAFREAERKFPGYRQVRERLKGLFD